MAVDRQAEDKLAEKDLEILAERSSLIQGLLLNPGWEILSEEVKQLYDIELKNLRSPRELSSDRIRGKLDAYEEVLALPQRIIARREIFR